MPCSIFRQFVTFSRGKVTEFQITAFNVFKLGSETNAGCVLENFEHFF